jgi:hypothetical protein
MVQATALLPAIHFDSPGKLDCATLRYIYLRPDQMKQLRALNEKTGAPIAELVRRAVDEYLARRAKEK